MRVESEVRGSAAWIGLDGGTWGLGKPAYRFAGGHISSTEQFYRRTSLFRFLSVGYWGTNTGRDVVLICEILNPIYSTTIGQDYVSNWSIHAARRRQQQTLTALTSANAPTTTNPAYH